MWCQSQGDRPLAGRVGVWWDRGSEGGAQTGIRYSLGHAPVAQGIGGRLLSVWPQVRILPGAPPAGGEWKDERA